MPYFAPPDRALYGERGWLCFADWLMPVEVLFREWYAAPMRSSASSSSAEFNDSPSMVGWPSSFRGGGGDV